MDDYVVVDLLARVKKADREHATYHALEDVQFLDPVISPVKFLVCMLERTVNGFRFGINPQLNADIVLDSGQASSTRVCATAGVKDRVVNETPLEKEEHSYFRTKVGRFLFLSVLRPDLQYTVGQFATHASAPTASDRIALKRLIRFLSVTCNMTLSHLPGQCRVVGGGHTEISHPSRCAVSRQRWRLWDQKIVPRKSSSRRL